MKKNTKKLLALGLAGWVRQHGEQLFADDNKSLACQDGQILVDYLDMWKDLMDAGAAANPDEYAQIQTLGQEADEILARNN